MARANGSTKGRMHDSFMITKTKPNDPRYKIDESRPVEVYRNLHKKCYSIKQDGLVKAHAQQLKLNDCTFHVNEKGRNRVRINKRKEVHAWVKGLIDLSRWWTDFSWMNPFNRIHYNPYENDGFIYRVETSAMSATFCEIVKTDCVALTIEGIYKV